MCRVHSTQVSVHQERHAPNLLLPKTTVYQGQPVYTYMTGKAGRPPRLVLRGKPFSGVHECPPASTYMLERCCHVTNEPSYGEMVGPVEQEVSADQEYTYMAGTARRPPPPTERGRTTTNTSSSLLSVQVLEGT